MEATHEYAGHLVWTGNSGTGTSSYQAYGREYRLEIAGKPDLLGSAHRAFRGDPALHDPEDLFLAALSSCHMLSYLALCARSGIRVLSYEDRARGTLVLRGDGGAFSEVVLSPEVVVADAAEVDRALALHETAHEQCYIAASCAVPIRHRASVKAVA